MRRIILVLILVLLWPGSPASAQTTSTPVMITSPRAGDVLQGMVKVTGTSAVDGFLSAEISFAYNDDVTGTWFLLAQSGQPVTGGQLATWDTTAITDGYYNLRLQVDNIDRTTSDVVIPNLQVRNYTPTEIPATPIPTETLQPTFTPILPTVIVTSFQSATPQPTPTTLPTNPAILPAKEILTSVLFGGAIAMGSFLLFVLYLRLRRK